MVTTLNLPQDMIDVDAFRALPSTEKSNYEEKIIEKILELNQGKGVTITAVIENTYFDRNSVSKYLEKLVAKRFAYKIIQGQTIVYHKNGRLVHHIFKRDIDIGDRSFSFKALFDGSEIVIFIQENKFFCFPVNSIYYIDQILTLSFYSWYYLIRNIRIYFQIILKEYRPSSYDYISGINSNIL